MTATPSPEGGLVAVPDPDLTLDQSAADLAQLRTALERHRDKLLEEIAANQEARDDANRRINECREDLKTVVRVLRGYTPRKRTGKS